MDLDPFKFIAVTNISVGYITRSRLYMVNPTGFLISVSAKKLLASLMQTVFKSYTCICIIQRVTCLDVKLHRLRHDNGLLSEYMATGCPVTYIPKFWRAQRTAPVHWWSTSALSGRVLVTLWTLRQSNFLGEDRVYTQFAGVGVNGLWWPVTWWTRWMPSAKLPAVQERFLFLIRLFLLFSHFRLNHSHI
jgi:hypothetical protein